MRDVSVARNALGGLRFWVFGIWLMYLVMTPLPQPRDVAFLPFKPPLVLQPFANLWYGAPGPETAAAARITLFVLVGAAALGVAPYRPIAIAASVLLTLMMALGQSFGNTNHTEVALLLATYPLAIFPAADGLAWPRRAAPPRTAALFETGVALIALLVLLPYTATASYRAAHHPYATFCTDALARWVEVTDIQYWSGGEAFDRSSRFASLLRLLMPVTTLFEIGAPLALRWRWWRRAWMVFAVLFHAGIGWTMHIYFFESMLLVPGVLLAVDRVAAAAESDQQTSP